MARSADNRHNQFGAAMINFAEHALPSPLRFIGEVSETWGLVHNAHTVSVKHRAVEALMRSETVQVEPFLQLVDDIADRLDPLRMKFDGRYHESQEVRQFFRAIPATFFGGATAMAVAEFITTGSPGILTGALLAKLVPTGIIGSAATGGISILQVFSQEFVKGLIMDETGRSKDYHDALVNQINAVSKRSGSDKEQIAQSIWDAVETNLIHRRHAQNMLDGKLVEEKYYDYKESRKLTELLKGSSVLFPRAPRRQYRQRASELQQAALVYDPNDPRNGTDTEGMLIGAYVPLSEIETSHTTPQVKIVLGTTKRRQPAKN